MSSKEINERKEKKPKEKKEKKKKEKEKDKSKAQDKEKQKEIEKSNLKEDGAKNIKKEQSDSDSFDEGLKNVSQKYKQTRAALKLKQKDEQFLTMTNQMEDQIPIKKKEEVLLDSNNKWAQQQQSQGLHIKPPEPSVNRQPMLSLQSSTTSVMQQTLNLGLYDKTSTGSYRIPQHLHKNYPHAIRLYVGNLPDAFDKEDFLRFFQKQMETSGGLLEPGQPIVLIQPQLDKKFLFAQFRSIEETSAAMSLDGIFYNGKVLRIRRVKDYELLPKVEGERQLPKLDVSKLSFQKISTMVNDGPLKLYVSGLAPEMEEESMISLLTQYGQLKSLHIVRDRASNVSKGYAFCEFHNEQEVMNCIQNLNNKPLNGRTIQVKRGIPTNLITADPGYKPSSQPHQIDTITIQEQQEWDSKLSIVQRMKTSCVLRLSNIIKVKEIEDDTEFYFVKKDIRRELDKIGKVISLLVPRKKDNHPEEAVGRVYVEFENENYSIVAYLLLQGKQYDQKDIAIEFYDAHLYADKIY